MAQKLTVDQLRRIQEIETYLKAVDRIKHLIGELEANRAAPARVLQSLSESIGREASHLRQKCLTSNVGTVADVAGAMSVMAGRGGGINMKIRALNDGVNSLSMQLDHALKVASTPDEAPPKEPSE